MAPAAASQAERRAIMVVGMGLGVLIGTLGGLAVSCVAAFGPHLLTQVRGGIALDHRSRGPPGSATHNRHAHTSAGPPAVAARRHGRRAGVCVDGADRNRRVVKRGQHRGACAHAVCSTHTRTHARTHARTHTLARTQAFSHTHVHARTHAHSLSCTLSFDTPPNRIRSYGTHARTRTGRRRQLRRDVVRRHARDSVRVHGARAPHG
jgi:hypothetical protein